MATNGDEPRDTTTDGDGTDNDEETVDGAVEAGDVDWRHPTPEQGAQRVPNGLVWHNPGFIPQTRRPVSTHRLDEDMERHFDSGAVTVEPTARDDTAARDGATDERIPPEQSADPADAAGAGPADDVHPDEDILD